MFVFSVQKYNSKEIKPVHPKGNQPRIFIGRTDAEAETEASILWPPDTKSQLTGKKSLMLGKTEGKRKGQQGLDGITDSMGMSLSTLWETEGQRGLAAIHKVTKSWTHPALKSTPWSGELQASGHSLPGSL